MTRSNQATNNNGKIHVEAMKKLARAGKGLSSYITRHVRDAYDK